MRLSILFLLLAALPRAGFAQQPPAADAAKRDLQAAQGTWELVRYERQGKVWGRKAIARDFKDKGRELLLRFEGDELFMGEDRNEKPYRLLRGGATQDHTFWLNPTKTPSRCDISFESGIFSRGM